MTKNRAWKSLLFKASHLDLEHQERKDILQKNKVEFDRLVCKEIGDDFYKSKYGDSDTKDLVKSDSILDEEQLETSEELEESESLPLEEDSKIPDGINKLWKIVALKTHPDRNKNNDDLTAYYIEASNALKEKEYGKLLIIALELGIKIPEDEDLIPYIKDNVKDLQQKISKIDDLALWKWINADEDQKKIIIQVTADIIKRNLQQS